MIYLHICLNIQGWWLLFVQILLDGHLTTISTGGNLWENHQGWFRQNLLIMW